MRGIAWSGGKAVYPRPRGGTTPFPANFIAVLGLSPPTRGNPERGQQRTDAVWSIPAHAGEPPRWTSAGGFLGVYPRPRGGTVAGGGYHGCREGLSPPTRGNHIRRDERHIRAGSIPAHAGEPRPERPPARTSGVYPRPRGGTRQSRPPCLSLSGLSPPTRGNHRRPFRDISWGRSIPAHAGEPFWDLLHTGDTTVYPRPRGGTIICQCDAGEPHGLSPPTRGNRAGLALLAGFARSIPAHAGEPISLPSAPFAFPVYPRPRGGTRAQTNPPKAVSGLSPPTRGNPTRRADLTINSGSIPAHAGEPHRNERRTYGVLVYPRPRGGTRVGVSGFVPRRGLSPPTRGNP